MKIEKNNVILMLWIKNDPDLWSELRDIQIKLLLDRIVREKSFAQMAIEYETDLEKIKLIFEAILCKIDRCICAEVATHLRTINAMIEQRPERPFQVFEVCLN